MRPLLLRGGRVIDPSRDLDETADLLIQDGQVAAVGRGLARPAAGKADATAGGGPGLVDVHPPAPGEEDPRPSRPARRGGGASPPSAPCRIPIRPSTTSRRSASW
jgi:dihydroorotase